MSRIFIVYRQSDSGTTARQIADRLASLYGAASIVTNVQDVPPGANLHDDTYQLATTSALILSILGPTWANDPRLGYPNDLVRFALETALTNRHVRVVPVLVGGAMPPNPQLLPSSLQGMGAQGIVSVRDGAFFEQDMQALIGVVAKVFTARPAAPAAPRPQPSPRRVESPDQPIVIVQRDGDSNGLNGCLMLPVRLITGIVGFLGSLVALVIRIMLASVIGFIMSLVIMAVVGGLLLLFAQSMLANNLDIGLALASIGQQISQFVQGLTPR